ncbi:MAG: hypothetical protein SNJ75_03975 [Gemmataceae bacterium]
MASPEVLDQVDSLADLSERLGGNLAGSGTPAARPGLGLRS